MELRDLVDQVEGFDALPLREKIRLFAWHLHSHKGMESFDNAAMRGCFEQLHLADPNVAKYLPRYANAKPADLVKIRSGYKLERSVRTALDAKYTLHQTVIQISKLLNDLPGRVPDLTEKNFLTEALSCYRIKAYRACVVMTWNLAYSHLLHWILTDPKRVERFNAAISRRYPNKKPVITIAKYDDFEELKESEVIEVCNTAAVLNGNIIRILREKLGKRNSAAHPSSIVVVQSQADDVITDLVNNVILALIEQDRAAGLPTKTNIRMHGTGGRFIEIRILLDDRDERRMEAIRNEIKQFAATLPEAFVSDIPRNPEGLTVLLVLPASIPTALSFLTSLRGIEQIGY